MTSDAWTAPWQHARQSYRTSRDILMMCGAIHSALIPYPVTKTRSGTAYTYVDYGLDVYRWNGKHRGIADDREIDRRYVASYIQLQGQRWVMCEDNSVYAAAAQLGPEVGCRTREFLTVWQALPHQDELFTWDEEG